MKTRPTALVPGILAALFATVGCGHESPAARTGAADSGQPSSTVRIGTPDGEGAIGRVMAARFTADGERVVVLDFAPPYVKVFRADGVLERAFVAEGGGPREMRHPTALAVLGDSLILVADGTRRIAVFGMDGRLRAEGRTPFSVLAAVRGCEPGEWLAYGPRFGAGDRPAWLHRLRVGARGIDVTEGDFRDAFGGGTIGNGLAYGIARDSGGIRVWHVLGTEPAVVGWRCGERETERWRVRPLSDRTSAEGGGDAVRMTVRMTVRPGNRTLAGMVAVPDGVILAAQVLPRPGEPTVTEYTLVTAEGERTVAVEGEYTIRDAHPAHGVLVSATDPVPHLFTISADSLRALFEPR